MIYLSIAEYGQPKSHSHAQRHFFMQRKQKPVRHVHNATIGSLHKTIELSVCACVRKEEWVRALARGTESGVTIAGGRLVAGGSVLRLIGASKATPEVAPTPHHQSLQQNLSD